MYAFLKSASDDRGKGFTCVTLSLIVFVYTPHSGKPPHPLCHILFVNIYVSYLVRKRAHGITAGPAGISFR
jgi:hypothetical protein